MSVDLSGLSGTITATRTMPSSLELANPTNVTTVTAAATRYATSTRPETTTGRVVIATDLNYVKFQTLNSVTGHTLIVYVIGWTHSKSTALWIPSLLTKLTVTGAAVSFTAGGGTVFPGLTYVKNLGDAKVYNGETGSVVNGFTIVDTAGCELVEFHLVTAAGASTANVLLNYI